MKANAPERIWIDSTNDLSKLSGHIDKDSVEYIRKEEPVIKGLEEVARNYGDELDNVLSVGIDDDNSIGEYATQAFKAGAQWQQEQMKSKAIDGLVICDKELTQGYKDIVFAMPNDLKVDDKVKVIIIKED